VLAFKPLITNHTQTVQKVSMFVADVAIKKRVYNKATLRAVDFGSGYCRVIQSS